ncbi:hypothetical protein C7390_1660 [Bacteroides galacturonicus]|nr:hypothetical protein C7390_1660 [Bacteroides galacturonicus]
MHKTSYSHNFNHFTGKKSKIRKWKKDKSKVKHKHINKYLEVKK